MKIIRHGSPVQNILFFITRTTLLLFVFGVFQAYAVDTYAQETHLTIKESKIELGELFNQIESQTDFYFFYSNDQIDKSLEVSVDVNNQTIFEILDIVLQNTDISYSVKNKAIILESTHTIKQVDQQSSKRQITGTIVDEHGDPIIGANVIERGTTNGTVTDIDGNFSISVEENAVLQISYIGYLQQDIKTTGRTSINVTLVEDTQALDELVVVGYGVQKRENLTGAVSQVKMEEVLGDRPIVNATSALQGAIPGLHITGNHEPGGGGLNFQIRDAYSLGSNSAIRPLVLIDNVEGNLDMINPDDIESITVLKDAASSAIYGARAAGGVIIVTTHQAKSNTRFQLNYNNNFGFETAINLPQQTDLDTYFRMYMEAGLGTSYWANGQDIQAWRNYLQEYKANPSAFDIMDDGLYKADDGLIYYLNEHDTYGQFMERSFMMNHNVSASGGTDKVRYRLSGGYSTQDGPLITDADKYDRLNVSAFLSADVNKWLTQVVDMKYSNSNKSMPGNPTGNLYNTRLLSYYPEGTIGSAYGFDEDYPVNTPRNTIIYGNNQKTEVNNPRIFLKSIVTPFADFEAVFEYTFDKRDTQYDYYSGQYTYTDIQQGLKNSVDNDRYRKRHYYTNYNAINLYGTYTKDIGKHSLKGMVGFNQESKYYENVDISVYNQASQSVPSLEGTTDKNLTTQVDTYEEYAIRGGFFRLNYSYENRYLLEVNGRYDGSSKFPKNSRFGFFPSVSAGWQLSREAFMEATQSWLDELKIRASWGEIGNQNISSYLYTPSMSLSIASNSHQMWLDNDSPVNVIGVPSLVRSNFTWEKVATTDVGVDISVLDTRLRLNYDWYQRNTTGMLAPGMQLTGVVGASAPFQNAADMITKGWEVGVTWKDKVGKVGYNIGVNLSDARTKVTKYNNESGLLGNFREGMYLGEIWGYVSDGFYTIDDFEDTSSWKLKEGVTNIDGYNSRLRPGDLKFKNLSDADGTENLITSGAGTAVDPGDRKIIGNNRARYLFGANLGVNYAGFNLGVILQGVGKRDYWLGSAALFPFGGAGPADAVFRPVYYNQTDYWTPRDPENGDYSAVNDNPALPRIYDYSRANAVGSNTRVSDKYLSSGAYMRVKNVTLSYTFPTNLIKPLTIHQLRLFVSGENLLTFSNLPKGYDPETMSWSYPAYRTISFGLNVTL